MAEKRNYYGNSVYNNSNTGSKDTGSSTPVWKQPAQFFHWLVYFLKNPVNAARQLISDSDIIKPLVLVAINIASVFIASIICVVIMNIRYSLYFSWVHIPSTGIIIFAVLLALVFDFGFPGLLFVSTSIIFKERTTFSKMLSITGGKIIIDSLFILAGSVLMLFGSFFFFISVATGNIISFTILITLYNKESRLMADKKVYSLSVPVVVISIIIIIMLKAVLSFSIGNILNYTGWF